MQLCKEVVCERLVAVSRLQLWLSEDWNGLRVCDWREHFSVFGWGSPVMASMPAAGQHMCVCLGI